MKSKTTNYFRTIWLSDLHLGTNACQADKLLEFLKNTESYYLFLVGDIVDLWALQSGSRWTAKHNTVVQKLLRKARQGTIIIYIPGNHDEAIREYCGMSFGDIHVERSYSYKLKNGKTVFITHGDEFDIVAKHHKWLAIIGDRGYTLLLWLNKTASLIRKVFGFTTHFSLSQFVKYKIKKAVNFISSYELAVVESVKHNGVDGVVTGHIHHAEIKEIDGVNYYNCGDGVESCTALVETLDGKMKIVKWDEVCETPNSR